MNTGKSQFLRRIAWLLLASMLLSFAACSQAPIIQPEEPADPTEPPVFIEPDFGEREVKLKNYNVLGQWQNSRVTASGEDSSVGPARSQDFNIYTKWNPQVLAGYAGEPGIEYELDRAYDVNKFVFTFASNYYFELYVSEDGEEETLVAVIDATNAKYAYDEGICTLEGLQLQNVRFVKLMFTGHVSNNLWISLNEVEFFETGATDVDISWMLPSTEPPATEPPTAPTTPDEPTGPSVPPTTDLTIEDYQVTGTFRDDRVWDDGHSDAGLGPHLSVDGKTTTYWNPCAEDQYAGEPGIIYTLNGWYDLTQIALTFGKADMSFIVYGSSHGEVYTELAKVDAENIGSVYTDKTATLALAGEGIRYVKIIFTGRPSNQLWISLYEVTLTGESVEEPEYVAPPATEPPATEPPATEPPATEPIIPGEEVKAEISGYQLSGEFSQSRVWDDGNEDAKIGPSKSFDGDPATQWNPTAKGGYAGEPGIIYMLDGLYDLTKLEMNTNTKKMYFKIYGSTDGNLFTELAAVTKDNAAGMYDGSVVTVPLAGKQVQYVKIVFTGRDDNGPWVTCNEVSVSGVQYDTPA